MCLELSGFPQYHADDCGHVSAEAIDQWFENLQNYEVTLEEMAAASLDVNFKEELSAIEQCRWLPCQCYTYMFM